MAILTRIGVTIEIVGVVVVSSCSSPTRSAAPRSCSRPTAPQGDGSYLWPFLASMLMAAYVMYGFDSAAELSEETGDPRRTAPKAIMRCMLISGVGGCLLILAALVAAPDQRAGALERRHRMGGDAQLGDVLGRIVLGVVAISIFSAALAIAASATRVMFSMARDGRLPFSGARYVSPRTKTPVWPGSLVSVLSIGVLLVNLGSDRRLHVGDVVSVVIVYLAYLFVTVPLLVKPSCGACSPRRSRPGTSPWAAWGLPVNMVAVVFGVFLLVNIGWPRQEIYDPAGDHGSCSTRRRSVGGALVLGAIAYGMRNQQVPAAARRRPPSSREASQRARERAAQPRAVRRTTTARRCRTGLRGRAGSPSRGRSHPPTTTCARRGRSTRRPARAPGRSSAPC